MEVPKGKRCYSICDFLGTDRFMQLDVLEVPKGMMKVPEGMRGVH